MTSPNELLQLAVDIALEAGELAHRRRTEGVTIAATKSALADIVTEADREVEELVRARLAAARPDDAFLGEEGGAGRGSTGIAWVVDPIDGTVNYAYGIPAWAVSIAAVQLADGDSEPDTATWTALAGVVYNPVVGELFRASRGGGAWLGDVALHVNDEVGLAGALLATGFGYDPATHAAALEQQAKVMPLARDIRRIGAASLDIAYVAAGRMDGFYEKGLQPWDHAAAVLLVTEAGGVAAGAPGGVPGREMTIVAGPGLFPRLSALIDY
ncbi:inositol monophosphatase family protein [Microbacterium sp. P07]|uniref:inositol monophosphatase family protein n=1 Tax=Microbacterium sp. P07 TaxID=3366952 RepID=UPI00374609B0